MKSDLVDIVTASVCKFNVSIEINGKLVPEVSPEPCETPCDYCRIAAEYICRQIEEVKDDQ